MLCSIRRSVNISAVARVSRLDPQGAGDIGLCADEEEFRALVIEEVGRVERNGAPAPEPLLKILREARPARRIEAGADGRGRFGFLTATT